MMRISWITPSNFVDVDLPIIVELQKSMEIFWQVTAEGRIDADMRNYIEPKLVHSKSIKVEYVEIPYRFFDLRTMHIYCRVLKKAKAFKPDLYYTSLQAAPFGPFIYQLYLPKNRTIASCHNVSTPKGANQETYARIFTDLHLRTFQNIQVFSETQKDVLYKKYPAKNVLLAPLAIKDYGNPTVPKRDFDEKNVVFLFFGMILNYKRVDLLIDAAQVLFEKGYKNFRVKIAGKCKNWELYEHHIKYPEIFDKRIERIPNEDVANLFVSSDYFVMPYQDIAQSGAITVAFRYNLPVILSDLPQFQPMITDGVSGLFFESMNVTDLAQKMAYVIEGGNTLHEKLKMGLAHSVEEKYSPSAIAAKYRHYFEDLLK